MKFSCDRSILNEINNIVQKAASPKSTIPALEGILIEVYEGGKIEFTAYDLSICISYTLSAEHTERGRVILSSRLFGEIIRKLPAGEVKVETDDRSFLTTIEGGNAHFSITGMEPENFPELPDVLSQDFAELTYSDLKTMVRQTIFAVSVTDLKPILTGVLFEVNQEEGKISAVAVDNFRLAIRKVPFVQINGDFNKVVIPSRALNELMKILPDSDSETVQIYKNKNFVAFRFGDVQMVSRLLEGEFLDYKAALPKAYKFRVKVNVRDLTNVIERASLMANSTIISPIRCTFDFDRIDIATASNLGSFDDTVYVEPFSDKMVIGFNYKYMLAALSACDEEEVFIELQSNLAPIIIKPMENEDALFLVLPLRMKE